METGPLLILKMTVKEHYDTHLARVYSWMTGDFQVKQNEFQALLKENDIISSNGKRAIDLGAGHGIQSIALAKLGFDVLAVDFSFQLLEELKSRDMGLAVEIRNDDIKRVKHFTNRKYDLVVCCGDTISHLDNKQEIEKFIADICSILNAGGKTILSFRDYSTALTGDSRFIHVKSDDATILTCILDYETERVRVTDLLNERTETSWSQKVSSYYKVRVLTKEIISTLEANGMSILLNQVINRMTTIIAERSH